MFWRHVVASSNAVETAGNDEYRDDHMGAIFTEGMSFSGFERNCAFLNLGANKEFATVSGVSGYDFLDDGRGSAVTLSSQVAVSEREAE